MDDHLNNNDPSVSSTNAANSSYILGSVSVNMNHDSPSKRLKTSDSPKAFLNTFFNTLPEELSSNNVDNSVINNSVNITSSSNMTATSNMITLPIFHPQQTSTNLNRIQFSSELLSQTISHPEVQASEYVYKSGTQYPPDLSRPRSGSILDILLQASPMIEIFSLEIKETVTYYSAFCHSCSTEYKRITAKKLQKHVGSVVHKRRLSAPPLSGVDEKEHSRRLLLISNPRFTPFLHLQEDQTLWCKWCDVQLPFTNCRIRDHQYTAKHLAAADNTEGGSLTETEKLKHLQKLVDMYPEVLALVDEYDKRSNDDFLEFYKTPDQITLQVNDLYCKPCRRKFERNNISSYHHAVVEHFQTKAHRKAVEQQQQNTSNVIFSQLMRPAVSPPKKITPRRHDQVDLIECARVFSQNDLAFSQIKGPGKTVAEAHVHRSVSSGPMIRGMHLLNKGNI